MGYLLFRHPTNGVSFRLNTRSTSLNTVLTLLLMVFGLAFFFSAFAGFILWKLLVRKKALAGVVLGGLCLAVSMACYQAYLGVVGVILLTIFSRLLLKNEDKKFIQKFMIAGVGLILTGGGLYWCITQLLLIRAGITLADYKGASNISIMGIFENLPYSVRECYKQFRAFFANSKMYYNLPVAEYLLCGCLVLFIGSFVYQFIRLVKQNKIYAFAYFISVLLIPIAANAVLLVAVGNSVTVLMSMAMILTMGGVLHIHIPCNSRPGKYMIGIYYFLALLLVWFGISTVSNDQLALKEGKVATITLSQNIMNVMIDSGLYEGTKPVALVGRPAENDMFPHNYAYETANEYARFGSWSTEAGNNRRSWMGVFSNFVGMNINLVGENEYNALILLEEVKEMPEFPSVGSIKEIQGAIVVKVSELY